jgi:hypothetical protein
LLDKAASDLFEFEVPCDVGRDENVREFAIGHEKFGDEIDVPVVYPPVFLPWLFAFVVVAVLFEELLHVSQDSTWRRLDSRLRY